LESKVIKESEIRRVLRFIKEREAIRIKKERGDPKPWTQDPILQQYRFTNVRREDDKVTKWIVEHWRKPHENDEHVWFAMCVARYINWPPTLKALGYPVPWKRVKVLRVMEAIRSGAYKIDAGQSRQLFGGAYFLNSIGPKIQSVVNDRLTVLWNNRDYICKMLEQARTLVDVYAVFKAQYGFGSFMAAQVVADLKYTPRFLNASDWWSWAAPGPGSKRGLNRLCGRTVNAPWKETEWRAALYELQTKLNAKLDSPLHAQDVQGIACCEWDKMERVRLGEGRSKTKYLGVK
jgi:hypothetical protein